MPEKKKITASVEDTKKFCEKMRGLEISEIGAPVKVFYCQDTDSALEALKRMVDNKISSMPVVESHGDDSKVIDFVDILDVCHAVVELAVETQNIPVHYSSPMNDIRLKDMTVGSIIRKCGRPFHQMADFLSTALDVVFAIINHKMRRVLVTDEEGEMKTVVTQSNVLKLIQENIDLLNPFYKRTLEELGVTKRKPACVNDTANAMNAMKLMAFDRYSCVCVVDDDGKLTGVVTARDLRAIFLSKELSYEIKELYQKLPDFLIKVRSGPNALTHSYTKTLNPKSTFKDAVDAFAESNLHHIVVIDEERKPVSVVTLTDLLGTMVLSNALLY